MWHYTKAFPIVVGIVDNSSTDTEATMVNITSVYIQR